MTLTKRVVVTTLMTWVVLLWGGPVAAAHTSLSVPSATTAAPAVAEPAGSDTTRSMLYAGIAGLAVGGVIAFWQSRKRRRNDDGKPGGGPDSSGS